MQRRRSLERAGPDCLTVDAVDLFQLYTLAVFFGLREQQIFEAVFRATPDRIVDISAESAGRFAIALDTALGHLSRSTLAPRPQVQEPGDREYVALLASFGGQHRAKVEALADYCRRGAFSVVTDELAAVEGLGGS